MSDANTRNSGRRQGSLLASAGVRPRQIGQVARSSGPTTSLLGQAVERERARQAHRDAAQLRKSQDHPEAAVPPNLPPRGAGDLFAGWDEPAAEAKPLADTVPPLAVTPMPADDEVWRPLIDPMALIGGVLRSKSLIAATTILGGLLGVVVALSTPKHYISWAELLVDPRNLQIVDRDLTGSGWLPSEATLSLIENQVRIMRSGPVMEKVVDTLKLDADPEFNGSAKGLGISAFLTSLRSLLSSSDGPTSGELRRAIAVENVAEALSIDRTGKTFIIEISSKTRDPQKSALIANTLIDVYTAKAAELQADSAGRASGELGGRLEELRKDVEKAERKVEDYKFQNDLVDAKGSLIGDDELIRLNDQLTASRARTLELNARAASARSLGVDTVIAGGLPEQVSSGAMAQLRVQYSTLAQEAAKAAVRLGPRHPERLALDAQLADARRGIGQELGRIVSSIQVELKRAVQLEQELAARLAQLKSRQANVSDKLIELREIERDAAAKRTVYESFLLRARETGEQQSINTGNISVVSRATPPLDPTGPSRAVTAVLGTVLGFMAGIGIGLLRGAWASFRTGRPSAPSAPMAPRRSPSRRRSSPEGQRAPAPKPAEASLVLAEPVSQQPAATVAPQPLSPPAAPQASQAPAPMATAQMVSPPIQPAWPPQAAVPPWYSPPQYMVWPQQAAWPPPMMPHAPVWMPSPAPAVPVGWPPAAPPAPPEEAVTDLRFETLRRGLSDVRAAVESLTAARARRG